jgi:hypothetical protein
MARNNTPLVYAMHDPRPGKVGGGAISQASTIQP